jgi:aminopeptidase N
MRSDTAQPVRLSDYRPPGWLVDTVDLDILLHPSATRVRAALTLRPNPAREDACPLELDGDGLTLVSIALDGSPLDASRYVAGPDGLTIAAPPRRVLRLEIETRLDPTANTQLMGLYRSRGTYCTQCEAEGFRRITYYPDRPDVMAVFTTRIEADMAECPVLLSNGNPVLGGEIADTGRHFQVWHDPFPKPAYLFALVGGKLADVRDSFTTMSGRKVDLVIYVEPGKEDRCDYAMDALKRSMRWDETAFGREYDLDIFMIVAVSDFNMGAMENKGLNIFNDKYVLALPDTATDADFAHIEAIIAHEYFHNWTGNRITCRDWFQLCLKEGLTVFRDQEFSSDMRSRPVKRIADVRLLRAHQFAEDAGPLAHAVRPEVYREINNFYTATVYEKGAEVIRMLRTLIGHEAFRAGMDLYFTRHDGEATTIEAFIACFAQASGRDLSAFMRWYRQAGTPAIAISTSYDASNRRLTIEATQTVPPTPGQPVKEPMVIPLRFGLVGETGEDLIFTRHDVHEGSPDILVLTEGRHVFVLEDVASQPVLSVNRGFSAPIRLTQSADTSGLRHLMAKDRDPFNRYEAAQSLAMQGLITHVAARNGRSSTALFDDFVAALGDVLHDATLEPAFMTQMLAVPTDADVARELGHDVDPDAIHAARSALRQRMGRLLAADLDRLYGAARHDGPYSPAAPDAGRRSLRLACLDLMMAARGADALARAHRHYGGADNMTDRAGALAVLAQHDSPERNAALADFYERHAGDALVIDKWFAIQATVAEPGTLARVQALTDHPAFSLANPNRVRALVGSFAAGNPTQFNREDGAGYNFVVDMVLDLDKRNPQVAARILSAFKSWRSLERERRHQAEAALRRVAGAAQLSADVADIAQRALA